MSHGKVRYRRGNHARSGGIWMTVKPRTRWLQFRALRQREKYAGWISKFGLDLRATNQDRMVGGICCRQT
jgi:hypothetical protein